MELQDLRITMTKFLANINIATNIRVKYELRHPRWHDDYCGDFDTLIEVYLEIEQKYADVEKLYHRKMIVNYTIKFELGEWEFNISRSA